MLFSHSFLKTAIGLTFQREKIAISYFSFYFIFQISLLGVEDRLISPWSANYVFTIIQSFTVDRRDSFYCLNCELFSLFCCEHSQYMHTIAIYFEICFFDPSLYSMLSVEIIEKIIVYFYFLSSIRVRIEVKWISRISLPPPPVSLSYTYLFIFLSLIMNKRNCRSLSWHHLRGMTRCF